MVFPFGMPHVFICSQALEGVRRFASMLAQPGLLLRSAKEQEQGKSSISSTQNQDE